MDEPAGHSPGGRELDLLFVPPDGPGRGRWQLCCRGSGEPPADVAPVRDLRSPRLRTGDPEFDRFVDVQTPEPQHWLMALDERGRRAVKAAVRGGWRCVGDDWVHNHAEGAPIEGSEGLLLADAAMDALAPSRSFGRERWQEAVVEDGPGLRRAQLLLHGARVGWLSADAAQDALGTETQPLVRLALFTLFLPSTVGEVAAALRAEDPELVAIAALTLARVEPRGTLRAQVEVALLGLLDHPVGGVLTALEAVGGGATLRVLSARAADQKPRAKPSEEEALLHRLQERASQTADEEPSNASSGEGPSRPGDA